ncbi:UDP-N-acetylmuramoyl-L-alanyl-D-glutamate--2,6-diaminopimelate ligase [Aureitalea marina]|uniref:UDP-N-acetylmuramoyl-L-alanyl-D-glutamate--2,6-diaminopimelate ligase n=1 Tax=Aureitalea marina TaxID=930804 RepID=A0A2S7KM65_9FLAO|nr:UDP-N-acetylmuramoyl-L-alanyl-D-glutamate--2,6-diaminopimelate ligase [Aureitalea marina]PQB03680.1 UDP-N-acetylmuramoyl-L-alanyl-D-glutamate--2,6-diaminopimelate ligase [Aureitalea marina]
MKILRDILYGVTIEKVIGSTAAAIQNIHFDSRKVQLNDLFVAIRGTQADGHDYIRKACEQGALVVVCEEIPELVINGVTYVEVSNSQDALSIMASNYYDNPSASLTLVGVTGTNGKTTVTTLLYQLFGAAGYATGLLSTVRVMVGNQEYAATHTTPDSLTINYYLSQMLEAGIEYCFMEVSSHGIDQGRTAGLSFAGGVFTNLSHDHLDYHETFKAYRDVKKSFFDGLPKSAFALTNVDDKNGAYMLQNTRAKKKTYSLKSVSDYSARILENQFNGLLLKIENNEIWVKLIGAFNAYNLLAVYATADLLGMDCLENLQLLSTLESVDGRFQYNLTEGQITTIVDYAHTPDALENVLSTINAIRTGNETLITVVGCGGDRDREKRPRMGAIAAASSNKVIFTSDNPRSEDPEAIIKAMVEGVSPEHFNRMLSITDRRQAIQTACQLADAGDIILVAGKGHETYQEIAGKRHDFDDFEIVNEYLNALNK